MNDSKIAINGFFGRMGQSIFKLSKKNNFNVTVGCDKQEKLSQESEILLLSSLSSNPVSFDVVIDFSLPEPSINVVKVC